MKWPSKEMYEYSRMDAETKLAFDAFYENEKDRFGPIFHIKDRLLSYCLRLVTIIYSNNRCLLETFYFKGH